MVLFSDFLSYLFAQFFSVLFDRVVSSFILHISRLFLFLSLTRIQITCLRKSSKSTRVLLCRLWLETVRNLLLRWHAKVIYLWFFFCFLLLMILLSKTNHVATQAEKSLNSEKSMDKLSFSLKLKLEQMRVCSRFVRAFREFFWNLFNGNGNFYRAENFFFCAIPLLLSWGKSVHSRKSSFRSLNI